MIKYRRNWLLFFTLVVLAFQGCASKQQLAHNSNFIEESLINLDYQSILLLNVRTKNALTTKHYLDSVALFLEKDSEEIIHKCTYSQNTFKNIDNYGFYNTYTLLTLDPGKYELKFVRGITRADISQGPSFGTGFFQVPLFKEINVERNQISYLGRVKAVLREKKDNEFSAGPATPLIPQSNTGIAKGTFDITIKDEFIVDQNSFVLRYPELAGKTIGKNVMAPWDKSGLLQYKPPATHFRFFN